MSFAEKESPVTAAQIVVGDAALRVEDVLALARGEVVPVLSTEPAFLARIEAEHRYAVIEMGANHAGEIAYLTALADRDVVVITNAGAAHLEGFGSIKGVSRAKGEILQNERSPRAAVLNADDRYFDYWTSLVEDVRCLSFGFSESADVRATDVAARDIADLKDNAIEVSDYVIEPAHRIKQRDRNTEPLQ